MMTTIDSTRKLHMAQNANKFYSGTPEEALSLVNKNIETLLSKKNSTREVSTKLEFISELSTFKIIRDYISTQITLGVTKISVDFSLRGITTIAPDGNQFKFATHIFNRKSGFIKHSEVVTAHDKLFHYGYSPAYFDNLADF